MPMKTCVDHLVDVIWRNPAAQQQPNDLIEGLRPVASAIDALDPWDPFLFARA
jgi:hypothetical protein